MPFDNGYGHSGNGDPAGNGGYSGYDGNDASIDGGGNAHGCDGDAGVSGADSKLRSDYGRRADDRANRVRNGGAADGSMAGNGYGGSGGYAACGDRAAYGGDSANGAYDGRDAYAVDGGYADNAAYAGGGGYGGHPDDRSGAQSHADARDRRRSHRRYVLQQQGYDTGRTRASRAYAGEQNADERASGGGPKTFSKPVILVLSLISCLACSYAAYSTAATGANMRMEQISSKLESSHSELREWLLENANAGEGSDEVSKATSMFLRQALDTCVTFNVFAGDGSYLRNASGTFTGIGDYIIASAHSLEGCGSLMMANSEDDESVPCRIIATDAGHDLVLVAPESPVAGHSNPVAPRADAEVGETVYAIGSHGVHESVAHGIVSGTGRFTFDPATREATMSGLLQVDATIGEAGCGGLVVNGYGEAIGIVVSLEYDRYSMDGDIAEDPEQAMGIAYALPWGEALAAAEAMAGAV